MAMSCYDVLFKPDFLEKFFVKRNRSASVKKNNDFGLRLLEDPFQKMLQIGEIAAKNRLPKAVKSFDFRQLDGYARDHYEENVSDGYIGCNGVPKRS